MKKALVIISILVMISRQSVISMPVNDTTVYLITCGPGIETYSIYGHSALRVVIPAQNLDIVYNWGVFDFDAPNFAWNFAKGRLDYMVVQQRTSSFLQEYFTDQRYVLSQKINLTASEMQKLLELVNVNMLPQNRKYKYDFFYDNCSTRIRDLLEKSVGKLLNYPTPEPGNPPTFRKLIGECQAQYPWYKFGVDLLVGSPAEKKAHFRDRMFLPIEMKNCLSEASVQRSGKMVPLLQNPEVMADFPTPSVKQHFFISPPSVFTLLIIIIMVLGGVIKNLKVLRYIDIFLFTIFTILAVFMIFFNFFTDHVQCRWNLNIIWLNPVIAVCLVMLILNKPGVVWFRLLFYITAFFLVCHYIMPQYFNVSSLLLGFILLVRSSVRAEFSWNPLTKR